MADLVPPAPEAHGSGPTRRCTGTSLPVKHRVFYLDEKKGPQTRGAEVKDEASYHCDSCGEEIVVPIDLTAGSRQASHRRQTIPRRFQSWSLCRAGNADHPVNGLAGCGA